MLLTLAGAVAVGVWLYLLLGRGFYWREFSQPSDPVAAPGTMPRIVAVIPARNEAAGIGRAVASLSGQVANIVVVDDASDDGTADIARQAAPPEGLTVLTGEPLPPGWSGKLWAVDQGVRHALRLNPDYLLLTDADIEHGPGNLAGLAGCAMSGGYDLVSYMARLHCGTLAEAALVPAFVYFFFALFPPKWIRHPRCATAGAAGGCMLIRREALERIGGIAAIRAELIDDCALARVVKQSGGRVWLGLGHTTHSLRVYDSFSEIERMVARSAFTQLRHSVWLLGGTLVGLAATYFLGPALILTGRPFPAILGALAWLLMSYSYFPALRFYRRSPLWAPVLPLVAAFYAWATFHSALQYWTGRGGRWKGRVQDITE